MFVIRTIMCLRYLLGDSPDVGTVQQVLSHSAARWNVLG